MVKDDETKVLGNLELCGVQDAECEATLHSIHDIFATNETKQFYFLMVKMKMHPTPKTDIFFCITSNIYVQLKLLLFATVTMFQQDYLYLVVKKYRYFPKTRKTRQY